MEGKYLSPQYSHLLPIPSLDFAIYIKFHSRLGLSKIIVNPDHFSLPSSRDRIYWCVSIGRTVFFLSFFL